MKDDPLDQTRQDAEALALFREALDHSTPKGGIERVRLATQRELPRRHKLSLKLQLLHPSWALPATAAVFVLAGAAWFYHPAVPEFGNPVVCPHGGPDRELNWRRMPASAQHEFLVNPDRFQRICHCTPVYSGNLRVQP